MSPRVQAGARRRIAGHSSVCLGGLVLAVVLGSQRGLASPAATESPPKAERADLAQLARRCREAGGHWNERWWRPSECRFVETIGTPEACAAVGGSWASTYSGPAHRPGHGFCEIRAFDRCVALGGTPSSTVADSFLQICDLYSEARKKCIESGFIWAHGAVSPVGPECIVECPPGARCVGGRVIPKPTWPLRFGSSCICPNVCSSTTSQ